jgi:hypothetical protein
MIDDYSPIYIGDTLVPLSVQFLHKDGTAVSLSGATISMKMESQDNPLTVKNCTGTWFIDDATNGKAHYQWQASDVATVGMWMLYAKITIGGLPVTADPKILEILPAP